MIPLRHPIPVYTPDHRAARVLSDQRLARRGRWFVYAAIGLVAGAVGIALVLIAR